MELDWTTKEPDEREELLLSTVTLLQLSFTLSLCIIAQFT